MRSANHPLTSSFGGQIALFAPVSTAMLQSAILMSLAGTKWSAASTTRKESKSSVAPIRSNARIARAPDTSFIITRSQLTSASAPGSRVARTVGCENLRRQTAALESSRLVARPGHTVDFAYVVNRGGHILCGS
jgi:hypothetical protein